jgi:hypothetical protein
MIKLNVSFLEILKEIILNGNVHDLTFMDEHDDDLYVLNKKYTNNSISLLATQRKNLKDYDFVYPQKKNMKDDPTFDKELYKKENPC